MPAAAFRIIAVVNRTMPLQLPFAEDALIERDRPTSRRAARNHC
jgi:hypothetical protein